MSEAEAVIAARDITQRFPHVHASPIDPKFFMTLHADRWTVQLLRDGVQLLAAQGRHCRAMLELFESWLHQADDAQ